MDICSIIMLLTLCISCIGVDRNDLYPFGPTVGDGRLPRNDDEFFPVNLSIVFPYFDEGERSLFVSNVVH